MAPGVRIVPVSGASLAAYESGDRRALLGHPHPVLLTMARNSTSGLRRLARLPVRTGHPRVDEWLDWFADPANVRLYGYIFTVSLAETELAGLEWDVDEAARTGDPAAYRAALDRMPSGDPRTFVHRAFSYGVLPREEEWAAMMEGTELFPDHHVLSALRAMRVGDDLQREQSPFEHDRPRLREEAERAERMLARDPADWNHSISVLSIWLGAGSRRRALRAFFGTLHVRSAKRRLLREVLAGATTP